MWLIVSFFRWLWLKTMKRRNRRGFQAWWVQPLFCFVSLDISPQYVFFTFVIFLYSPSSPNIWIYIRFCPYPGVSLIGCTVTRVSLWFQINLEAQGAHSHILMTGDPSDFFGSEILAQSDFFGSMKRRQDFFGSQKKTRGIFWGCKKRTRGFFWVC